MDGLLAAPRLPSRRGDGRRSCALATVGGEAWWAMEGAHEHPMCHDALADVQACPAAPHPIRRARQSHRHPLRTGQHLHSAQIPRVAHINMPHFYPAKCRCRCLCSVGVAEGQAASLPGVPSHTQPLCLARH